MTLSLGQIVDDLNNNSDSPTNNAAKLAASAQSQPAAVSKDSLSSTLATPTLASIEQLVDSVRNIRAMTDEVMDARARIDEILENAKELDVIVDTHQIPSAPSPSST